MSLLDVIEAKRVYNEKFERESLGIFNEEWDYLEGVINTFLCKFMNGTVSYNSEGACTYDINKCQHILQKQQTTLVYSIPKYQEYVKSLHQLNIQLKYHRSEHPGCVEIKTTVKNLNENPEFIVTIYY